LDYPKRLIEVDLPIKRISAHARREKSIRHGHISTLHIWWARRPLAACRAVICAALWPDPADEKCPVAFREEARRLMTDWAKDHLDLTSPESMSRFNRVKNDPEVLADDVELRKALLDFIADFANWDNATSEPFLAMSSALVQAAHVALGGTDGTRPLVVDSFAGGGAIPLEAMRVGADAFASDLNPIPILLNKVALEYIPRYGTALSDEVRKWGAWVKDQVATSLAEFYPPSPNGATPIAYLWSRTILSEAPADTHEAPVEVPLMRSMWLAKRAGTNRAMRWVTDKAGKVQTDIVDVTYWEAGKPVQRKVRRPRIELFEPTSEREVGASTVARGSATCPVTGYTTPVASVRKQLTLRRGGAADARLLAVRQDNPQTGAREWRLPTQSDEQAAIKAAHAVHRTDSPNPLAISAPSEPTPLGGGRGAGRAFSQRHYGMAHFRDLFTPRQLVALTSFSTCVATVAENIERAGGQPHLASAVQVCLALALDRLADFCSSLCVLNTVGGRGVKNTFSRQALPIVWDFAETNPLNDVGANWQGGIDACVDTIIAESGKLSGGNVSQASATANPLPSDSAAAFVTDPPYYDAIPYSDLSDYFYVWLKRTTPADVRHVFSAELAPKNEECIVDDAKGKGHAFFEAAMTKAMSEGRRITQPDGVGVVVFAHKTTSGWEAQLKGMIEAGWKVTGSWPIDTERPGRLRAQASAALASSVHLVCRPREDEAGNVPTGDVGDWRAVLSELPQRIHEWMPRLAEEGVVGADAIFACLGPALEIFSRYSRVEKASGEVVTLREYLEQVWAAVSTEALSMIFRDADAAGLESDARFTAIVLWTLGAGGSSSSESSEGESADAEEEDDEDESPKGKAAKGGYTLEYDAARKIAQGLGVNLEQIDSVVEVKGDKARLRPVSERAAALFGKAEKAEAVTKKRGKKAAQKKLFDKDAEEGGGTADTVTIGEGAAATPGVTALDRVHQAMLLFAGGRAEALKRFIVEDGVGGDARFWKLAQSLSALYPAGSDEKRWVDGVLARKKSFGF
jgi:adenine-specific DNA methylase